MKKKYLSLLLVLSIIFGSLSLSFTASSRTTNSVGISYNESIMHTLENESISNVLIGADIDAENLSIVDDANASYGKVLKMTTANNGRVCFDDLEVIKNRKYYIYFDAKAETDGVKINSLIGTAKNSGGCRNFFSGYQNKNSGVSFFINGTNVSGTNFKLSTEWRRYGLIVDTSNSALLAEILSNGENYSSFWDKDIRFLFGIQNGTAYFDNIQLIEIDARPNAVPNLEKLSAAASVRFPKSAIENNGSYLSAGLRFKAIINNSIKDTADEIGFLITPSVCAIEDSTWYDISNGVKENTRLGACYVKGSFDTVYAQSSAQTAYQVILTGLSNAQGNTAYVQRFCCAMYVISNGSITYYALGETSFNETKATYNVLNMNTNNGTTNNGITLSINGVSEESGLTYGDTLPVLDDIVTQKATRHKFLGWYDQNGYNHTKVPNSVDTLYARYEGYSQYTFDEGKYYNPNNASYISAVDDPFGGNGKVLYSPISGNIRGLVPAICDGITTEGFNFKKNHTYSVSFKYRFANTDPDNAKFRLELWGVNQQGVYVSGNKVEIEYPDALVPSSGVVTNQGDWATCTFKVTNVTDYPYLYIRFLTYTADYTYNVYIDDLIIADLSIYKDGDVVKLINGGKVEETNLLVGDKLPVLADIDDEFTGFTFTFDGWYDETLTTRYTSVVEGITTYYAKFNQYSLITFETNGIYDPNYKYNGNLGAINSWERAIDPKNPDNFCIKAVLGSNHNNTHFAPQLVEGISQGIQMTKGKKYVVSFDCYIESKNPIVKEQAVGIRGSAISNIGAGGNKTDQLTSQTVTHVNAWLSTEMFANVNFDASGSPYLIITSQNNHMSDLSTSTRVPDLNVYLDNICVREISGDVEISIKTKAENVSLNNNGEVTIRNDFNIGDDIPAPKNTIDGVNFIGWYNEALNVPYKTIQFRDTNLYAKYDAAFNNFENNSLINPNKNLNERIKITADPVDPDNSVVSVNLNKTHGNLHFVLGESSYGANPTPYRLTVGNTYTISYRYYLENANEKGVSVQFRGSKEENVGISGGKSSPYGTNTFKEQNKWISVTTTFTYKGAGIESEPDAYLLMLAQDASQSLGASACTATIYFDDIIIKEKVAETTYTKKDIKVGNWTLGYAGRPHNIVVPSNNFSYLAMMQLEKLQATLEGITGTKFNIVKEKDWTEASNQFNIFVSDVVGHSRDNQNYKIDTSDFTYDDFAYVFGKGNIYIDGGNTEALAMAISELNRQLTEAETSTSYAMGTRVDGLYSERIEYYSTRDYYRGTFLEDFDGEDINTDVWNEIEGSVITSALEGWKSKRSDEHTYLEDGNLVIEAAYNEEEKMFYGGMIKTHGKMEYRYGYMEVSCITPHGRGLWTATWTNHHNSGTGFYSSEVDINESFGNATYSAFNMHSWPTSAAYNMGYNKYALDNVAGCSSKRAVADTEAGFAYDYHTFGYYWTENCAKFTVDGFVVFEYYYDDVHTCKHFSGSITNNDYDAFNETLSLIVSMTVGNGGTSNQDPIIGADYWNTTNKYIVDYVHIYQIDGQDMFFY